MKSLKWVTIITCIFFLISLSTLIIFFLLGSHWTLGYDISLAVSGSSILGFVMSAIQYFAEKRKNMELFFTRSMAVLMQLRNLPYFMLAYDEALMIEVIKEEALVNRPDCKVVYAAKFKLIEEIKKEYQNHIEDTTALNKVAENRYREIIDETIIDLRNCMKEYIKLSYLDCTSLNSAYGNLDFIFSNKTTRRFAYESIYSKLIMVVAVVSAKRVDFESYFDAQHPNTPIMLNFLLDFNNRFFASEKKTTEYGEFNLIYNQLYDETLESLNEFKCKIYRWKFAKPNPVPIAQYQKFTKDKD